MDRLVLRPALDILAAEDDAGTAVLVLRGELDCSTASMLRHRIREAVAAGTSTVVLDVRRLSFLDAAGLGVLVGAHRRLRERGGGLVVRDAPAPVRRVLRITDLEGLLEPGPPPAGAGDPRRRASGVLVRDASVDELRAPR